MVTPKKYRRMMQSWLTTPKLVSGACLTPRKKVYTKQQAKREIKRLRSLGMYLHTYQCDCLWWHLTKKKQKGVSDEVARD